MPVNADRRVTFEPNRPAIRDRSPLPSVGSMFSLPRRIETVGGFICQGVDCEIASAWYDNYGEAMVNLSRGGRVVASGVSWPMVGIPNGELHEGTTAGTCKAASDRRETLPRMVPGLVESTPPDEVRTDDAARRATIVDEDPGRAVDRPLGDLDRARSGIGPATLPRGDECSSVAVRLRETIGVCGIVVLVDFMNLLVRAWFAGKPSKIHAVKSMFGTVANIIERLSPEYLIFALDGGHAERTRLLPNYKSHRPEKPPGLDDQIQLAQAALEALGFPMIRAIGWEADDVIASLVKQLEGFSAGTIVCSSDKDLLQLAGPAQIYHPWDCGQFMAGKAVQEKFGVRPGQVGDYLALIGDTSDGVPGVNGIGPKKAAELLGQFGTLEKILDEARLLRVVGAAGKKLREGSEIARLSRRLVELQSDLPIPESWSDWPVQSPRSGWPDQLRKLDLGFCVQRLAEVIPQSGRVRSGSPLVQFEWERGEIESFEIQPGTIVPITPEKVVSNAGETLSGRRGIQSSAPSDGGRGVTAKNRDPVATDGEAPGPRNAPILDEPREDAGLEFSDPGSSDGSQFRRPVLSVDFTRPDWIENFPVLRDFPPGTDRSTLSRSVYATAVRLVRAGRKTENLWRPGTDFHRAEQLAIDGLPFETAEGGLISVPSPAISSPEAAPKKGCLF